MSESEGYELDWKDHGHADHASDLQIFAWPWTMAEVTQDNDGLWSAWLWNIDTQRGLDLGLYRTRQRAKRAVEMATSILRASSTDEFVGKDDVGAITATKQVSVVTSMRIEHPGGVDVLAG